MPRALTLQHIEGGKPGEVYYPIQIKEVPRPTPGPHEVLVRLTAAALNHRDLFIRHHQYPGISFTTPMLADGYGIVIEAGNAVTRSNLLNKPVILTPMRGWDSDPIGPEDPSKWSINGGTKMHNIGTAQDFVVVHEDEVEPAPDHLSPVEGAALPLVGLTAWRALVTKSECASPGKNILITGIGGGVALSALQFAVAFGCNVYVTSGDQSKIDKAKVLGAKGGVNYKGNAWDKELKAMLPRERPFLDAVIDGAGGNLVPKVVRLLRSGGRIVQYGMTVSPKMDWHMSAVLSNIELRGSTMGSRKEFSEMIAFVNEKKVRPVISRAIKSLSNLEAINGLFAEMEAGKQFGKLVIEIEGDNGSASKL